MWFGSTTVAAHYELSLRIFFLLFPQNFAGTAGRDFCFLLRDPCFVCLCSFLSRQKLISSTSQSGVKIEIYLALEKSSNYFYRILTVGNFHEFQAISTWDTKWSISVFFAKCQREKHFSQKENNDIIGARLQLYLYNPSEY